MPQKTNFNKILKELKLTEEQLQSIYEDVATTNKLVNNFLNISKIKLREIPEHLLKQLRTQKEKDLKRITEKEDEERKTMIEKQKAEEAEKYYEENFEKIMIEKIDNNENLTEEELDRLRDFEIDSKEEDESGRWSKTVYSYVKLCDRLFCLTWECGLTEMQPNEFYNQPYEVENKTYEKTITVTEYVPINRHKE